MSNQMTTPINSIPITTNVKPNDDIQDPLVQEILGNMAESASKNVEQTYIKEQTPVQEQYKPQYNYPIEKENKSFIESFYDKKIMILTGIMLIVIIVIYSENFENVINKIEISYVQDYKQYFKYIVLYLILYIIQKNEF